MLVIQQTDHKAKCHDFIRRRQCDIRQNSQGTEVKYGLIAT